MRGPGVGGFGAGGVPPVAAGAAAVLVAPGAREEPSKITARVPPPGRRSRCAPHDPQDWGWGAVVSVMRRPPPGAARVAVGGGDSGDGGGAAAAAAAAGGDPAHYYIVDVLLACAPGSIDAKAPRPAAAGDKAEAAVLPVALPLLEAVGSLRVALPGDLRPADARCVGHRAACSRAGRLAAPPRHRRIRCCTAPSPRARTDASLRSASPRPSTLPTLAPQAERVGVAA